MFAKLEDVDHRDYLDLHIYESHEGYLELTLRDSPVRIMLSWAEPNPPSGPPVLVWRLATPCNAPWQSFVEKKGE